MATKTYKELEAEILGDPERRHVRATDQRSELHRQLPGAAADVEDVIAFRDAGDLDQAGGQRLAIPPDVAVVGGSSSASLTARMLTDHRSSIISACQPRM